MSFLGDDMFTLLLPCSFFYHPLGEKPFLCDKCGRGFNRVDNLRSHVKTVHQGKAGMKRLVVAGGDSDDGGDGFHGGSASEMDESEINIVTVTTEDIATLAGSTVSQLTGQMERMLGNVVQTAGRRGLCNGCDCKRNRMKGRWLCKSKKEMDSEQRE